MDKDLLAEQDMLLTTYRDALVATRIDKTHGRFFALHQPRLGSWYNKDTAFVSVLTPIKR